MKNPLFLSVIALFIALPLSAIEVVYSQHRSKASFQRISEYFTGEENLGRYAVARTDEGRREGFYIALKVEIEDAPESWKSLRLTHVKIGSQEEHAVILPINGKLRKRLLVGLTEIEWKNSNSRPLAWKIEVLDSQGTVMAAAQSFLWSPQE